MTNDRDRTPVLEAKQMSAGYGAVEVVKDLDLVVHSGRSWPCSESTGRARRQS